MLEIRGLSDAEAKARLSVDGYNELSHKQQRTILRITAEILKEPMFSLLIAGGAVYLALGDRAEAFLLLAFATLSVVTAVVQEGRSERVLIALRNLTSPRALVVRDKVRKRIPGREVVRGDVIVLSEGDRVPADGRLIAGDDLMADESLLTGESVPVRKALGSTEGAARPGGDDLPFVFGGSLIVRGHGMVEIFATGPRSEIGKIGTSLGKIESVPARLATQIKRLVRLAAVGCLLVSGAAVLLHGMMQGNWLEALLGGIAVGMAMLPEEFPLVITVFMVMGAWRISRARVLTRRASAIETLGSATVLCTDKTGTLTENRMTVVELRTGGLSYRPPIGAIEPLQARFYALLETCVLASAIEPFDPMEKAFHAVERKARPEHSHPHQGRTLVRSWGLRPDLLAVTQAWQSKEKDESIIATKGAPEAIARLCRLSADATEKILADVDAMASEGMRILGVARARIDSSVCPNAPTDVEFEFLGLVGLADPLRKEVPSAIAECHAAGIKVIMITGDYPATARAIGRQAGLAPGRLMTGEDVDRLNDQQLAEAVRSVITFARVLPAQKLRIVEALRANGEVVGMTGDGVNDAPSLKAADIGIAMGSRGTDVAREAASIVLLDDNFSSIVETIRLGRRIYDNLRKAIGYIIAVHVPIAGLSIIPLLFGMPLVLAPAHIAFMEMIIDPVCSIVFEAESEERDLMNRLPRSAESALIPAELIIWNLLQGGLTFLLVGGVYFVGIWRDMPTDEVRALTFCTLIFANLSLILINRSFSSSLQQALSRKNPALYVVLMVVLPLLFLTVNWEPARSLFRFGAIQVVHLSMSLVAALTMIIVLELLKGLWRVKLTR